MPIQAKRAVKRFLNRLAPGLLAIWSSLRLRQKNRNLFWDRQLVVAKTLYPDGNVVVKYGPFSGMKYINEIVWGPIEPKWLGTYEQELHNIIGKVVLRDYETVIDVGSAEGYYSVGLALTLSNVNVISFEIDPISRRQQARLAKLNNVTNLKIRSFCQPKDIDRVTQGRTLLICDIEGFEFQLLNPKKSSRLRDIDILVEVHDFDCMSMNQIAYDLRSRFSKTHVISSVAAQQRLASSELPFVVPEYNYSDLLDEHRTEGQIWLWMQADKMGCDFECRDS